MLYKICKIKQTDGHRERERERERERDRERLYNKKFF